MDDWRSYDGVAETYQRVHAPRFAEPARDLIGALGVEEGQRVLDIGTGTGAAAEEIARTGAGVVGVDRSLHMLSVAHRERPSLPFAAADVLDLPFRDRTFDVVAGNFVFAHFAKVETALFELTRVLSRGGRIGFTTWSDGKDAFQDTWTELIETVIPRDMLAPAYAGAAPGHDRFKQPQAVEDALRKAGFRPVRTERRRYQWTYPRDDLVDGLGTWAVGRFARNMLGESSWASFLERARTTFADRFPDPLNDFRDVILAVGTSPS
ncbi:MAG TPA: methyltransferase domain-containing protein [Actinomycetota bacterium]|nr:methyltransferase domain-containing protein [Actinomycetota bacterium]